MTETIRICKDRNVLKEYLKSHEEEVVDIMMALYDHEEILNAYLKEQIRERVAEQVKERVAEQVKERVADAVRVAVGTAALEAELRGKQEGKLEGKLEAVREMALKMKEAGMTLENIAQFVGYDADEVRRWLES